MPAWPAEPTDSVLGPGEPFHGIGPDVAAMSSDQSRHDPTPALMRSNGWPVAATSIIAVVIGLGVSFLIIALKGEAAGQAAQPLYDGSFGTRRQAAATIARALPLALVALGWIVAFTARRINVGFEGQIIAGGIAAVPWVRRGVNEIVSTLLLNFVALQLFGWLIRGPWQGRGARSAGTRLIPDSARWPNLVERTPLNYDLLLVAGLVLIVMFVLRHTSLGIALRLTGANVEAARATGLPTARVGALSLVISGALACLAGADLVLGGETGAVQEGFAATFGLEGIDVSNNDACTLSSEGLGNRAT